MTITEPTTMATDYILGFVSVFLAGRLLNQARRHKAPAIAVWAIAFLATGIAAFIGGTYHGFTEPLGSIGQAATWKATLYLIGVMSLTMATGSTLARIPNPTKKILLFFIALKFLFFAIWMVNHDDFKYVIYDYAPTMIGIALIHGWSFFRNGNGRGDGWILLGIALSLGGAVLQQTGFSLHQHLNHNDIYHIVQIVAMLAFYRGARLMQN